MVPTVSQQLAAIRHTIAKTIMPAIAAEEGFAQEQAGLVLASLDWALDVVDAQGTYEQVEHAEYRDALGALLALGDETDAEAGATLRSAEEPPAGLPGLRAQTLALKSATERVFVRLTADPSSPPADPARRIVSGVARSQVERELAWARMTGFPKGVQRSVGELVADGPQVAGTPG